MLPNVANLRRPMFRDTGTAMLLHRAQPSASHRQEYLGVHHCASGPTMQKDLAATLPQVTSLEKAQTQMPTLDEVVAQCKQVRPPKPLLPLVPLA